MRWLLLISMVGLFLWFLYQAVLWILLPVRAAAWFIERWLRS